MSFNQFGCEKIDIESIRRFAQRNVLIYEYCSENFSYLNLVDIYYRSLDSNAILVFLFICIMFPVLFMLIATVADKYLASGMKDLSERFGLSPTIAAMTLLAFGNGAPDILGALGSAGKPGGELISVGSLCGAFLFSTCLVASNVIQNAKDNVVNLPKGAVIKELLYYAIALSIIICFGIRKSAGWPFVFTYIGCYASYVVVTLVMESGKKEDDVKKQLEEFNDLVDEENAGGDAVNPENDETKENAEDKAEENKEGDEPEKVAEKETEVGEVIEEKEKGVIGKACAEMFPEGSSLIENVVVGPLLLTSMFFNCYLTNPLMVFPFKFVVISNSVFFMLHFLELTELPVLHLFIIGYSLGALFFILELVKLSQFFLDILYEIISVFAAIGWISLFAGMVIDCIGFLAFYFSINAVILATLLLSAGNTVGDYFGNGALAKSGEEVMAMMGVYSGQMFNNFVGFGATMAAATAKGFTNFDIFALDYEYFKPDGEPNPLPMGSYFLAVVMGFVFIDIILTLVVHFSNRFVATKNFGTVMQPYYGLFFVTSLVFGFISRG